MKPALNPFFNMNNLSKTERALQPQLAAAAQPVAQTLSLLYRRLKVCIPTLLACALAFLPATLKADDLDAAFASLTNGRVYLKGYPGIKTRRVLVDDFLGANGQTPNRPALIDAVNKAIAIRQTEPDEPSSFPSGQPPRSIQAKVIAWESLESLLTGYLYAGNRDLMDSIRMAYPGSQSANDTREMPREEPAVFSGTSQKQITYARLYFFQGIKDILNYVAEDTTGSLRAGSSIYPTVPHYVTFDDELSEILPFPRFDDPNFGGPAIQDREASQSVAYLYGSAMERYGMSSVAYAEQLWKSAYAGPGAGLKRSDTEKTQMLQYASDLLKNNIHAQFLASLPLAAKLSDGADNTINEFTQAKIDQSRVSVTDALRLRQQILAGEKPTQTALISAWDTTAIEQQLIRCKDAHEAARVKWAGDATPPADGSVAYELQRTEEAQSLNATREIALRTSMETQLLEITGIDPSLYGGLRDEIQRNAYLQAVQDKFVTLVNAQDVSSAGFNDGGSKMSIQALKLVQAIKEAYAKKASIDSYGQKMRAELQKNNDINATIIFQGSVYAVIDAVITLADAQSVQRGQNGPFTTVLFETRPLAYQAAIQAGVKAIQKATETVAINSINSEAIIRNLLIEQQVAIAELPVVGLNSSIAAAELQGLLMQATRLVQDHAFYQDITDKLWYRDPSLTFKLEKAEEEYRDLMQEYRIELYKLARMIETSWGERYQNPVKNAAGSVNGNTINNGSYDDFTEAESIFSVVNHVRGESFYNAIKAWDFKLRDSSFRGPPSAVVWDANSFSGQPISLRRDIFKLIDYRYDYDGNQYLEDTSLNRQSIQLFRARLLDLANRDAVNAGGLNRLRIDFPLAYNQARVILGQSDTVPIVQQNRPGGSFDQFWNHRTKKVGVKIVGKNVFASGTTVPISFELFGNIDRIGFFPDSLYTYSRTITTFQVPLYQRDPDKRQVGEPFFGTAIGIPAAIGQTPVPMNDVDWPLFCDNIVLRIDSQGTMRIENIEDIEFYFQMQVGSPPAIPDSSW